MQGDRAEESILRALKRCLEKHELFDVIVIIRGGGGEADLHCFDSYEIGRYIATIPVPVISGIGHQRDRTVVDEVAHTTVKTPTAAAELIIHTTRDFDLSINELRKSLTDTAKSRLSDSSLLLYNVSRDIEKNVMRFLTIEESKLDRFTKYLTAARKVIISHFERLEIHKMRCVSHANQKIREHRNTMGHLGVLFRKSIRKMTMDLKRSLQDKQKHIGLLDPENILKRGYSITYKNSQLLKDIQNISYGDIINTVLHTGTIKSNVTEIYKDGKEKTTKV
jgi:exodeoxyribonuclease VII large subunit